MIESQLTSQAGRRLAHRGDVDHAIGFVGIPSCGKSALMTRRALEIVSATPGYIIAHDAERQFKDKLPPQLGGWSTGILRFDTVAGADAYVTKHGAQALGRVLAISCLDAAEVVTFAHAVAARSLAQSRTDVAPCVVLMIDEVANCKEMGAGYLGDTLKAALVLRRHRHTAILWASQSPQRIHYEFLANKTELYVFRLDSTEALERLEKHAGVAATSLQLVQQLKQYQYIRIEPAGFKVRG